MIELGCYPLDLKFAKSHCVNFDSPRQQFLAGRLCAQAALESNGYAYPDEVLHRDDRGAPLWPNGYIGSITHTSGFAAAMVAVSSKVMGLGIDSEMMIHRERAESVIFEIVTPSEWDRLQRIGSELAFEQLAILCFSAKESVYKCVSPLLRKSFGFHSVELIHIDPKRQTFQARLLIERGSFVPTINGKFKFIDGMVHTISWILHADS